MCKSWRISENILSMVELLCFFFLGLHGHWCWNQVLVSFAFSVVNLSI